jgi:hypothetical protein
LWSQELCLCNILYFIKVKLFVILIHTAIAEKSNQDCYIKVLDVLYIHYITVYIIHYFCLCFRHWPTCSCFGWRSCKQQWCDVAGCSQPVSGRGGKMAGLHACDTLLQGMHHTLPCMCVPCLPCILSIPMCRQASSTLSNNFRVPLLL